VVQLASIDVKVEEDGKDREDREDGRAGETWGAIPQQEAINNEGDCKSDDGENEGLAAKREQRVCGRWVRASKWL